MQQTWLFVLVQDVQEEGKHAIDSPGSPTAPDLPPEEYTLG
jgi:parvin